MNGPTIDEMLDELDRLGWYPLIDGLGAARPWQDEPDNPENKRWHAVFQHDGVIGDPLALPHPDSAEMRSLRDARLRGYADTLTEAVAIVLAQANGR